MAACHGVLGCDRGTPDPSTGLGPPPRVVWTYPANNAVKIPLLPLIRVQFDRFLASATAIRQSVCLQSATVGGMSPTDQCTGGTIAPQYDPVERVVVWRLGAVLLPYTRYNLRLLVPKNDQDPAGIRAFDGVPLEKEFVFAFTTGDKDVPSVMPHRDIRFCSSHPLCALPGNVCSGPSPVSVPEGPHDFLRTSCTSGASCHGGQPRAEGPVGSILRLDDGPDGGVAAAVRRLVDNAEVATETATGPDPQKPSRGALSVFGRNMPYLDAGNPGNSFLLYKMILAAPPRCPFDPDEESAISDPSACTELGGHVTEGFKEDFYDCQDIPDAEMAPDPAGFCPSDAGVAPPAIKMGQKGDFFPALVEPLIPPSEWQPAAPGEYERLRQRIRGSPMPYGGMAARQNASALSAWIAAGAIVETCRDSPGPR